MSDENLERITILLQARDRDFARAMDRNNKLIARMTRGADRDMAQMSRAVNSRLDEMARSASSFGVNFARGLAVGAITTAVAGITAAVRGAVSNLSALGKAARDAGIDVEELQGLQRGFSRAARMSEDDLTRALIDFNVRIGQAAEGQGEFARISERLGISLRRPNGEMRTQAQLLREVADRIQAAGSASERAAIAQGAFGQVGRRMADALSGGSDVIRQMNDQARASGDIIDANLIHRAEILDDKFDALTRRVGTFFRALAVGALAGGAETATDTLVRMFGTIERAQAVLGEPLFESLIAEVGELSEIDGVVEQLRDIAFSVEELRRGSFAAQGDIAGFSSALQEMGLSGVASEMANVYLELSRADQAFQRGEMSAEDFEKKLSEAVRAAMSLAAGLGDVDRARFGSVIASLGNLLRGLQAARAEASRLRAELPGAATGNFETPGTRFGPGNNEPLGSGNRVTPVVTEGVGGTARPRRAPPLLGEPAPAASASRGGSGANQDYAESVAAIREQTVALELEAAAFLAVAASGRAYADAVEFARRRAELLLAAQRQGLELTPALRAEVDQLAEAYVLAADATEQARDRLQEMRDDANRGIDAMTDLFMAIAQGGDAARRALAQLAAQAARTFAQRGFEALAGLGGGTGSFFGFLGGLLGGKRAAGGPVRAGEAYLVNENTPNSELFVPSRSGGILNVAQAKDALRGSGATQGHIVVELRGDMLEARIAEGAGRVVVRHTAGIVQQSVEATYQANREFALT
jgi:hypothetical protein